MNKQYDFRVPRKSLSLSKQRLNEFTQKISSGITLAGRFERDLSEEQLDRSVEWQELVGDAFRCLDQLNSMFKGHNRFKEFTQRRNIPPHDNDPVVYGYQCYNTHKHSIQLSGKLIFAWFINL